MNNQITGKMHTIFETQTFPSGFTKREFVIDDCAEKYPQLIKFEAMKDGCTRLDSFKVGDEIVVDYNLRGNEFNGKFYVSLQAWKFTKVQAQDTLPPGRQQPASMPPAPKPAPGMADSLDEDDEEDSIPF